MPQDPANVDSKHYKVEFENDKVRVLRVNYAPGEKSVMHGHPETVVISLGDARGTFSYPDGKSEEFDMKAGQVIWAPAHEHLPESAPGSAVNVILVEIK